MGGLFPSLLVFILFLPLLFMFGWLPQADTFTTWLAEQLDIHLFGGTPATGLLCSLYSLGRSMAVAAVLWPLGWAAFHTLNVCYFACFFFSVLSFFSP